MSSRGRSCYDWQWISTDNILTRQEILEFLITVGRVGGKGGGRYRGRGGGGGCWEMSSRGRSCYDWQWISTDNILTRQEILEFLITVGRVRGKGGGGGIGVGGGGIAGKCPAEGEAATTGSGSAQTIY